MQLASNLAITPSVTLQVAESMAKLELMAREATQNITKRALYITVQIFNYKSNCKPSINRYEYTWKKKLFTFNNFKKSIYLNFLGEHIEEDPVYILFLPII